MLSQLEYEGSLAASGSEPLPRPGPAGGRAAPSREKSGRAVGGGGGGGSSGGNERRKAAGAISSDGSVSRTGAAVARRAGTRGTATQAGGEESEMARAMELSLMQEAW